METSLSTKEYLEIERITDLRHEWIDGQLWAMQGTGIAHNTISVNIPCLLYGQLRGHNCEVLMKQMRVKISQPDTYVYPDALVVCGEPQFDHTMPHTLLNPQIIIEVLSPEDQRYDKARKWKLYRTLESLTDYILVSQDKISVQHYRRLENNDWLLHIAESRDEVLEITSIECHLSIAEIYERIDFSPTPPNQDAPHETL